MRDVTVVRHPAVLRDLSRFEAFLGIEHEHAPNEVFAV